MTSPEVPKRSKLELLKDGSRQLRGTIAEELLNDSDEFTGDSCQLLKHHGSYQQDDRDLRKAKNPDGTRKGKAFSCMIRTRVPGGKVTAEQFLAELDLCDQYGDGTVRLTTRQGFQLHGVIKGNLKAAIKGINDSKLTTLAACGDVNRNVMACPAPYKNNAIFDSMQDMAYALAEHLKPKTTSYFDLWITDEAGNKTNEAEFQPVEEPIYGKVYLPRKFKIGIALPEDNCVDIYTQDIGLLAIVENEEIIGYNFYVGGGMGVTPSNKKTYAALAKPLGFVENDQVLAVAEAVVKVQRDFGNREDRKQARMKYLVNNLGIEKFREKVSEYLGGPLIAPRDIEVTGIDDHMGWHDQGDGKLFFGVNIENGRIKDEGDLRIKTGLRKILETYQFDARITAKQSVIFCDIDPADRDAIEQILVDHGMKKADELTLIRRFSMSCPALPMCGLSVTESERVLPDLITEFEEELTRQGLQGERISVNMTGCPNGCARPYIPDIGLVGKAVGKYTLFLGGNSLGNRLAFIYDDMVPLGEITSRLSPLLEYYKEERQTDESFGDFCHRKGKESLQEKAGLTAK
ncbi:MAG: NADPH-dependent assimilatory sulfite reductase hemoprotein subunit [Planctomycetes bacterium]|nr:NADPH-dependent assimilatory sulfite reductase hemoprotein subunit [Planctomycetota bacterium]MCH9726575.1 NADPH-dependent assimilatory sulfite reductase hemoprotein subunit [Planctomycetota bacterium]MCH9779244.1 NADPH-dependent assimilatory sulfite reductase hemoprotein subunit [Planctomycetota bacterium]MCH9792929.1 NADPH-dependent assimilatory sulfite reductase hemoprotein subunit [Planctomycetota bacterium]MDF1743167.1 NADPH-dependent assimilatory sulfite reductase hemoprotein subunit [